MRLINEFAKVAAKNQKKIAVITETNQLTYEDMLNLLYACDVQLRVRGMREGATVVLHTDKLEFYILFVLLASHRELNVIFSGIDAVLRAEVDFDFYISTAHTDKVPDDKKLIIEADWFSALGTSPLPDYRTDAKPNAKYTFVSSGSTGLPKFIRQSETARTNNLLAHARMPGAAEHSTRFLSTLSVTMGWAMFANVSALLAGGSAVILDDDRDKLLQYIDLYQVNNIITTPATLSRITDIPNAAQYLGSVSHIRAGGAYTSNALLDKFTEIYSGQLMVGYGATEVGGVSMMDYADFDRKAEGCIGKIYRDDVEVAFFDEDLNLLPDAMEGIVGFKQTKNPSERGYLVEQDAKAKTGFIGGYFFPGDIMRREGDWLFITGRVKNIINFSGNKISLEAIQTSLETIVPRGLVACVALPDDLGLEQLYVFYDGHHTIDLDDVNAVLKASIGQITAKEVRKLAKLPLLPSGKLDMEALKRNVN